VALGGDRGHRPAEPPNARAAALARAEAAARTAHRLALEVERLRSMDHASHAALARALTESRVPTPRGGANWTHTTVARLLARTQRVGGMTAATVDGGASRQEA
jgi:hypothetical protein